MPALTLTMTPDAVPYKYSISSFRSSTLSDVEENNTDVSERRRLFATPAAISHLISVFFQGESNFVNFSLTLPHYTENIFGDFGEEKRRFRCVKDKVLSFALDDAYTQP